MDKDLLMQGIEEMKSGKPSSMASLLALAMELEKQLARFGALCSCTLDGTVYTKDDKREEPLVSKVDQYGELYFVLRTIRDAGKEMEKLAKKALEGTTDRKGNDGHMQRFAELLRSMGLTSVKVENIGTCYIKTKSQAYPPSKTEGQAPVQIGYFLNLCKSVSLDPEKASMEELKTIAEENKLPLPPYIAFQVYMREMGLTHESWNWASLQKHVADIVERGEEPPEFITVLQKEEVMLRSS